MAVPPGAPWWNDDPWNLHNVLAGGGLASVDLSFSRQALAQAFSRQARAQAIRMCPTPVPTKSGRTASPRPELRCLGFSVSTTSRAAEPGDVRVDSWVLLRLCCRVVVVGLVARRSSVILRQPFDHTYTADRGPLRHASNVGWLSPVFHLPGEPLPVAPNEPRELPPARHGSLD